VTDHVAERRTFAANLASHSHDNSSPILAKINKVSSLAEFGTMRTRFDFSHLCDFTVSVASEENPSKTLHYFSTRFLATSQALKSECGDHVFHSRCLRGNAQVQSLQQKQKFNGSD
jgi:hypothetical protein